MRFISFGVTLLVLCGPVRAQGFLGTGGLRAPTIDELVAVERIGSARISPDGAHIVYELTRTDLDQDKFVTQLSLVDTASKVSIELTRGKTSSTDPQWSPDGDWIAFLAAREEDQNQIHLIRPDGGEAFPITNVETGVSSFRWSNNGASIAFTAREPESDAVEARDAYYGEFEVVRREYLHTHLFTLDVAEAIASPQKGRQRTRDKKLSVGDFSWSPDDTRIAFDAVSNPDLVNLHTRDIYLLNVISGVVTTLVANEGPDGDPIWSPDGGRIAFATSGNRREFFPYNQEIGVISADGDGFRIVSAEFDEYASPLAWRRDGIYFTGLQKTASHLFRVNAFTGILERISEPVDLMASTFSLADAANTFAFVATTPESLPDVFIQRAGYALPVPLTDMTQQVKGLDLARRETIRWTSRDGTPIEGVLHKPRDFDERRQYPLLVVIHGGPTGTDRPGLLQGARNYPTDIWTSRGALVLRVNYRGSAGYGEAFRTLNIRNLGVGDAWDVETGVEHLVARGWADPDRVGCMGWSQGGYISAFLSTNSDLFRAVSVGAGISNWATYYYNTDITQFTINYLGADPASDPGIYAKTSPMTNVLRAKTPTLIQHGENDARVPIPNAYELRQGLEDRGVPVEMIVYKGFGHGIDKPRGLRAVLQHNLDWFNHYLWGDPMPDWIEPQLPENENGDDDDN